MAASRESRPLSATAKAFGWIGGRIDRVYYSASCLVAGKARPKLFSRGWGDSTPLFEEHARRMQRIRSGNSILEEPLLVEFELADAASVCQPGVSARYGQATSPLAHLLPPSTAIVHVLYITDAAARAPWDPSVEGAADTRPRRIIVLLPATGEECFTDRVNLSKDFIAQGRKSGVSTACVMIMAPFYGTRRPPGQVQGYISTVHHYLAQSLALMLESAGIIGWAHSTAGHVDVRLAVTGFSWGAAMAAASSLMAVSVLPASVAATRLAVVPYVGSVSPIPLVDGVLADDVDWHALEADSPSGGPSARDRLRALLMSATSEEIVKALADAPWSTDTRMLGALHSVGMLHDGFVLTRFSGELHDMLATRTRPGRAHVEWRGGGHVIAYLCKHSVQIPAVLRALACLE
jgi:hypothetical protein